MKEVKLKFTKTEKGIYIYLTTDEKDILLTEVMISRAKDQMLIVDSINLIEYRLIAQKNYETILKTVAEALKENGDYEDLRLMVNRTLSKFSE